MLWCRCLAFVSVVFSFSLRWQSRWSRLTDAYSFTVVKTSGASTPKSASLPGKPRNAAAGSSKPKTQPGTPRSGKTSAKPGGSGSVTPTTTAGPSRLQQDLAALHLEAEANDEDGERERERYKEKPGLNMKQEELIAKVKRDEEETGKQSISLIVVGERHSHSTVS